MASVDILCSNTLKLKNKITKIEHKEIFCGQSKSLKNVSWPLNMCLQYFMTPIKTRRFPLLHPKENFQNSCLHYMLKVNNQNNKARCKTYLKLTVMAPE